jgi:chromosome segregation ATPase
LIDHQPILSKQMEMLRLDIQQLNNFIINEGEMNQGNRAVLIDNLNRLIRMRFAEKEEKITQTDNFTVTVTQPQESLKVTDSTDKLEKENTKLKHEIIRLEERISTQDQLLSLLKDKMTPDAKNIVNEISRAKLETEEAKVTMVKANNEKYELKKMVDQLKEDIRIKDSNTEESSRKLRKAEAEFASSVKDYERTIRGLKDELEESLKENKFLLKELEVMERDLLNTRKNLTNAAIEIDEMEKAEQENLRRTKEITKELTGKENEIEELKREMARNIGGLLNTLSPSKMMLAGRRSMVIQQEENLESLKEDNEILRRKVKEKQQEIFDLTLALDQAKASKDSPEKTNFEASINLNELKREISEVNRQNTKLRDLVKEKDAKIADMETILEGNKKVREIRLLDPGMPGMKASTASLDPDYKMKDLVRQLDISRAREEELEKENEIMKLENKTLGKDIRNLEARYEDEVRDLKTLIEQGKEGYRSTYQTPVEMSNQKTSQKYKETIDILNEENEAFMKENFQLKKLIKQKDRQLEELIDKLEGSGSSFPKKVDENTGISDQLRNKIIKLEKEKEDLVEQLMSQKMESSQNLQIDDNSLRVSLNKLAKELESSERETNLIGKKLKEKELESKEVKAEAEEYRKKLVESNESIAALKSQVKELQSRLGSITDELNDLKINHRQRTDVGDKLPVEPLANRTDEVEQRDYIKKLKERINELELQVGDNYELKRLRNQISRLTQETEELKLDHEEVSRRLKDKQSQNLKLMDEKESLLQQLKEQSRAREETSRETEINSKSDFKIFRSNRNTEKEGQETEVGKDRSWAELQDLKKVMGKIKNTLGEDLSFPDHQIPQKIDGLIDDATINSRHVKSLQNENTELLEKLNRLLGKPNEEELQNTTLHERSKLNESYGFEVEDLQRDVKQLREINRKLLEEKMNLESRLRRGGQDEGETSHASVSRMKESDADLDRMLDKFRKDREVYSKDAAILRDRVSELQQQDNRSQQQIAGLEKYSKDLERALHLFFSDPVIAGITGVTNVELSRGKKTQFVDLLDDLAALLKKRQRSERIEREALERELEELRVLGMTKRSEYIGKESLDDTMNASQNPMEQFEKELLKKTEELSKHKVQLQDLEFKYEDILKEVRRLKLSNQSQQSLLQLLSLDTESHLHLPKHELLCKIPEYLDLQQVVQDLLRQKSSSAQLSSEGRSLERPEQFFDSEKGRINQMLGDYRRMEEQLSMARAQLEGKNQEIGVLKNLVQEERIRSESLQSKYSKMKKEVGTLEGKIRELGGLSLEGKEALLKDNGKLKKLGQMYEDRIKEVEQENAELQDKYEKGMQAMKEKYERMKEKMLSHEEDKRATHQDSIELLKKRVEELTALVVELRETNKILEEARKKDINKNSDLRKKEDIIKEADGRLYAHRQRLQEKEKALESKEESLARLERELKEQEEEQQQAMGKSQVSQLENAGSVKELAGQLQALDIDGAYVGKQFLNGLRGNGSAALSLEAAL